MSTPNPNPSRNFTSFPTPGNTEPIQFNQGDTVIWQKFFANQPSTNGWTVIYHFRGATGSADVTGVGQSDGSFVFTMTPTQSQQFVAGPVYFQAVATFTDGTVNTVSDSQMTCIASLASLTTFDGRTPAQTIFDAIEAKIATGNDVTSATINGKSINRMNMNDLIKARDRYKQITILEQAQRRIDMGLGSGFQVNVRFSKALGPAVGLRSGLNFLQP